MILNGPIRMKVIVSCHFHIIDPNECLTFAFSGQSALIRTSLQADLRSLVTGELLLQALQTLQTLQQSANIVSSACAF